MANNVKGMFAKSAGIVLILILISLFASRTERAADKLPLGSHLSKAYRDDLHGLLKRRYIRVLTTLNRTNFFISKGRAFGYEYAMMKGYEKFLNRHIKKHELQVVIEFIPVTRDQLIPRLVAGYGDIAAAGLTITPEREKSVVFTNPYLYGVDEVVVTHRGDFRPSKPSDLSGRKVFVRKSSSYYQSVTALNRRLLKQGKRPVQIIAADEELETESILEMVNSGAVETTIVDSHIAAIWSDIFKNIEVHYSVRLRTGSKIAWMVRKENKQLLASLNEYLQTHKKGTLLGNIYFKRYYGNNKWLKNPTSPDGLKRMRRYKDLIKKYANRYGYDWKLIMAIAFQESGFNPAKKSSCGAVGLMQVLPTTAQDTRVNVNNIDKVENNIHAGVKYLSILQKDYFDDNRIRIRDQIRFALASYNAGPAKINKARQLAKRMGLDSNRWFRNVEVAVLRLVGQETVRYVSNINKYYNLYNIALDKQ
jgi:membrane-bound lytic murein transglycosylase MltF